MSNCVAVKCMVCKKLLEPSDALHHMTSTGHNLWEIKRRRIMTFIKLAAGGVGRLYCLKNVRTDQREKMEDW